MAPVRFFAPDTDAYVDSVKRHAAELTQKTGLDVEFRIITVRPGIGFESLHAWA